MSEHHGHDHSHAVVTEGNVKKLSFALALTTTFLIIEVIAGFYDAKFGAIVRCGTYVH